MKRRNVLLGLGGLTAAGGIVGSGAFTSVEADRTVSVAVADDADALLALEPTGSVNGKAFVTATNGQLAIDLDDTDSGGDGLGTDSTYDFDDLFRVTNQGTQTVYVVGTFGSVDPFDAVWFYPGSDRNKKLTGGQQHVVELGVGESATLGLHLDTSDVPVDTSHTLDATITASSSRPDDAGVVGPGQGCTSCSFEASTKSTSSEVTVRSTYADTFPQVSTFFCVDTTAGDAGNIDVSDVAACEDGCQPDDVDLEFTDQSVPMDVVFLLDMDMGGGYDDLKTNIETLATEITNDGIDAQFALYLVGNDDVSSAKAVKRKCDLSDRSTFETAVTDSSSIEVGHGTKTDGYEAILRADDELNFRQGAQRVIVDITDSLHQEDTDVDDDDVAGEPETRDSAMDVLRKYTYVGVAPDDDSSNQHHPKEIADDANGVWYLLDKNNDDMLFFDPSLGVVVDDITTAYRLTYTSPAPTANGFTRNLVFEVNDPNGDTLYGTGKYDAPL